MIDANQAKMLEGIAIADAQAVLGERLCRQLRYLGIGSNGVPTAFHDAELYPALQLRADAGLRLILQLIKAGILEAADPNLQRLKLTAFGRAIVGNAGTALDAYIDEVQATPPTHFEQAISEIASEDSGFAERIRQSLAGNDD